MSYRLYEYRCPECGRQEEFLVELDEEGLPVAPMCTCPSTPTLERVYTPIRAVFGHGFFSHDRPRRVEVCYEDADGKKIHKDLTHEIDINNAPGRFHDYGEEKF